MRVQSFARLARSSRNGSALPHRASRSSLILLTVATVFGCADGPLGQEGGGSLAPQDSGASSTRAGDDSGGEEDRAVVPSPPIDQNGSPEAGAHDQVDDRVGSDSGSTAEDAGERPNAGELVDASSLELDGSTSSDAGLQASYRWNLPAHFPRPQVPPDNPMTEAKVELGRYLFYDLRLSRNGTFSCATCHKQALAFTDGLATAIGSTGVQHPRSSMGLANVAYSQTLTWANPLMMQLERQAIVPTFGDAPVELGNVSIPDVEARFRAIPRYAQLFSAAFPDEPEPVSLLHLNRALAAFQRTIISGDSAFDRYEFGGEVGALSEAAKRGRVLVTTDADPRFKCSSCHGGFNFSDHVTWEGKPYQPPIYHQTGLYDVDGQGAYPAPNTGVYDTSQEDADMGKFKAPTLRNVALTAPYMHDGSLATLSDVLDHYAKGGRARSATRTDPLLHPFAISAQEKADVIAFLESLTDDSLLHESRLSDPWQADAGR
jgi:cytochrome c peroxidase